MKSIINIFSARVAWMIVIASVLMAGGVSVASAETLMMPNRDARMGTPLVVWGVTTQSNGTAYTIDYGDSTSASGIVGDRSYIAFNHTYATQGTFTATLTVAAEVATVEVQVFDVALLPGGAIGDANRSLGINMAIEDGLRHLWTTQASRAANFPVGVTTFWSNSYRYADTSLITLAFQNHDYRLANDSSAPTGLYEKYIVRRGLNYVMSQLSTVTINVTPQGDDPCVGVIDGPAPCVGLQTPSRRGYSVAVAMLPFAASGALTRVNTEVAGVTSGKTFGEILQRLSNAQAWGQRDGTGIDRGGWIYNFNSSGFDGSTAGWAILGFLDAAAAGVIVPPWVSAEFKFGFDNALNNNGSFDYRADGNPAALTSPGPAKVGIGLQGLFFIGEFAGVRVDAVTTNINSWWPGASPFGIGGNPWGGHNNHGGGYAMFNMFKGLKLHGIVTLPDVARPAGPGTQPVGDWHADYQDWLVANQSANGTWGPAMSFSCCYSGDSLETAMAELILSPVALVLPDEDKFSTVGLSPVMGTEVEGGTHTVTAHAESTGGTPVPGATINFVILTGPNAGLTGTDVTDSNGDATFTYTDAGPGGSIAIDTIQASIGSSINSNIVQMIWTPLNSPPVADANGPYSGDEGSPIALDGSGSNDPDGDPMTYSWTVDSALCSFLGATAESPTITCTDNGLFNVTLTVTDDSGLSDTAPSIVDVANVAPDLGPITAPTDPVAVNAAVDISADFTDPGSNDTHTATCDWGDGTVEACTVNEAGGNGGVTGSHSYTGAGVYQITVTVTDDDGGSDTEISEYVVVYDPEGGFVTGGGWINSPAGAYVADEALKGTANFGFISKYKKGANTPDGSTQFTYQVGNLNFHSNTYDWLVVAGAKAQFKGVGTVNGMPGYSFMLTAADGDLKSDDSFDVDGFRMKIWNAGGVIYDNGLGGAIEAAPQDIAQGSIVIHVPKGGKK